MRETLLEENKKVYFVRDESTVVIQRKLIPIELQLRSFDQDFLFLESPVPNGRAMQDDMMEQQKLDKYFQVA